MNKEEMLKKFEENVAYLERNIPPDDIYMFTEQTFMAALYFLNKWSEHVDLKDQALLDPVAKKWIMNIMGLVILRDKNMDVQIDLDLKSLEE